MKFDTRVTAGDINCTISGTVFVIIEALSGKGSCSGGGIKELGIESGVAVGVRGGFVAPEGAND